MTAPSARSSSTRIEASAGGDFFVRSGPGTVKLSTDSANEYIRTRFSATR